MQAWAKIATKCAAPSGGPGGSKGKGGHGEATPTLPAGPVLDDTTRAWLEEAADNVPELLRRLRSWLGGDGSTSAVETTLNVFRSFDSDGSMEISLKEMRQGLASLGYAAPSNAVLEAIFDEIDEDATYKIGFVEFKTWLQRGLNINHAKQVMRSAVDSVGGLLVAEKNVPRDLNTDVSTIFGSDRERGGA